MGRDADDLGIYRLSLRFRAEGVESGFIKHNTQRRSWGLFLVGATLFVSSAGFLVPACAMNPRKCASDPPKALKRSSDMLLAIIGLVLMATMDAQRRRPFLTDRTVERLAAFGAIVILIVGTFGELTSKTSCKTYLLLFIDTCVTVPHVTLPVRWCLLWPLEIVALALYPVWTQVESIYGAQTSSPAAPVGHVTLLAVLIVATALGKRDMETREREVYASLIRERTLRAQSDFRMSQQLERTPLGRPASSDSDSKAVPSDFGEDLRRREHGLLDV